jgi:hypothetical protein
MAALIRTASSTIAGIAITGDRKPIGLHLGFERICSEPIFIELRRNVGTAVTVPATTVSSIPADSISSLT